MKKLILLLTTVTSMLSCQTEPLENNSNSLTDTNANNRFFLTTECEITGSTIVLPNSYASYSYTVNFSNAQITWSVEAGDISIVSTNGGNTIRLYFGPTFDGGSIIANGIGGSLNCADRLVINKEPEETFDCPSQSCLALSTLDCTDAIAYLDCAKDVAYVDWEYSIASHTNVPIGRSTSGRDGRIIKSFSFPRGNWNNYYIVVIANITLKDGSECERTTRNLLSCSDSGDPRL